jgi:hypothetical protein
MILSISLNIINYQLKIKFLLQNLSSFPEWGKIMTKINQVKENQREIEYPGNAGSPLLVRY